MKNLVKPVVGMNLLVVDLVTEDIKPGVHVAILKQIRRNRVFQHNENIPLIISHMLRAISYTAARVST